MKKIIAKLRTASFWVTLAGALTLILGRLGYADAATLSENIVEGIGGILLVLGIIASPPQVKTDQESEEQQTDSDKPDANDQTEK